MLNFGNSLLDVLADAVVYGPGLRVGAIIRKI